MFELAFLANIIMAIVVLAVIVHQLYILFGGFHEHAAFYGHLVFWLAHATVFAFGAVLRLLSWWKAHSVPW